MATVFLPKGRKSWSAQIKVWNQSSGKLEWKKVATGAEDRDSAMDIARALERASGEARDGSMTKAKVERLVRHILSLAGFHDGVKAESLESFGGRLIAGRVENVSAGTKEKYEQHWARFKTWAGARIKRRCDQWTPLEMTAYYKDLLGAVDVGTANDHLRTLNMIFMSAMSHQQVKINPLKLVERQTPERSEKVPITQEEFQKLLKRMRKDGREDWRVLTRFGWHTGHRIQDLLSLTAATALEERDGIGWCVQIQPKKKKGRGGRLVVLPIPRDLAEEFQKLGDFKSIHRANNDNGKASNDFVDWLKNAGIDPMPIKKKSRVVHMKSFHSFRHAMTSRLIAAGVTGEVARLITDHDSKDIQKIYTHAEVKALAEALKKIE